MQAIIQKYFDAFGRKDLKCIEGLLGVDVTLQDPVVGCVTDRPQILKIYEGIFQACHNMQIKLLRVYQRSDESFAAEFSFTFTDEQKKPHQVDGVDLIEFRSGKIVSLRAYLDSH